MSFEMREGAKGAELPPNKVVTPEYSGKGVVLDEYGIPTSERFFHFLHEGIKATVVRHLDAGVKLSEGLKLLRSVCLRARFEEKAGAKVILIGNGGSSAIASHITTDFSKNGGIRAVAFNDAPMLTCLSNDFGTEEIFAKQLEFYALAHDVVIIVSSSGKSANILRAAEKAFEMGLTLITFSGMNPANVLRRKGLMSFFVPARDYGLVELAHLSLLHSVVSVQGEM